MPLEALSGANGLLAMDVHVLVVRCHPWRAARVGAQAQSSHGRRDRWVALAAVGAGTVLL